MRRSDATEALVCSCEQYLLSLKFRDVAFGLGSHRARVLMAKQIRLKWEKLDNLGPPLTLLPAERGSRWRSEAVAHRGIPFKSADAVGALTNPVHTRKPILCGFTLAMTWVSVSPDFFDVISWF